MAMLPKSRVVFTVFVLLSLLHFLPASCNQEEERGLQSEVSRSNFDRDSVARQRFRQFLRNQGTDSPRTVLQSPMGQEKSQILDIWGRELMAPIRSQEDRTADRRLLNKRTRQGTPSHMSLRGSIIGFSTHLSIGFRLPYYLRSPFSATLVFGDNLNVIRESIQYTCNSEQSPENYGQIVPSGEMDPLVQPKIYMGDVKGCVQGAVEAGDSEIVVHLSLPCFRQPELCQPDDYPLILITQ